MTISTCPYPNNINPLILTGYQFVISKLPELTYFIQSTKIPDVSLGAITQASSVHDVKIPGETMEFSELSLSFVIDEDLSNWNAIYFWIIGLGYPEGHWMYRQFQNAPINSALQTEALRGVSDGTLTVLDSSNNPKQIFTFVDLFPTSLSGLSFDATSTDSSPAIGNATFAYSYYKINKQIGD